MNKGAELFRKRVHGYAKGSGNVKRSKNFQPVNPAHRGDFTRKAKAAGMSVDQYANKVLSPSSTASTQTKRQAAFTRARKTWRNA